MSIGILICVVALLLEAVLSGYFYAAWAPAYGRSDVVILLVVTPTAAIAVSALLLVLVVKRWPAAAKASFACPIGCAIGSIGLVAALVSGPHLAGFFIFWPLVIQAGMHAAATLHQLVRSRP